MVWLIKFNQAWNMVLDVPLPVWLRRESEDEDPSSILSYMPLIGAVLGLVAYVVIWVLALFAGHTAAAIIVGVGLVFGLEIITSARGLSAVTSWLETRAEKIPPAQLVYQLDDDYAEGRTSFGTACMMCLLLLRMACVGVLVFYDAGFWLGIALTANYSLQGVLATCQDCRTEEPLIETEGEVQHQIWALAGVLFLLFGWSCVPAAIISFIALLFAGWGAQKYAMEKFNGVTPVLLGAFGYVIETIAMMGGVILLVRA